MHMWGKHMNTIFVHDSWVYLLARIFQISTEFWSVVSVGVDNSMTNRTTDNFPDNIHLCHFANKQTTEHDKRNIVFWAANETVIVGIDWY